MYIGYLFLAVVFLVVNEHDVSLLEKIPFTVHRLQFTDLDDE